MRRRLKDNTGQSTATDSYQATAAPASPLDGSDIEELEAQQAEAEAEAAEAAASAAQARARSLQLRALIESARCDEIFGAASPSLPDPEGSGRATGSVSDVGRDTDNGLGEIDNDSTEGTVTVDSEQPGAHGTEQSDGRRPTGRRRVRLLRVGVALIVALAICAAIAAGGWMMMQHRVAVEQRHRAVEFTAAAKQGIVTLMAMDFTKAKEDVQQIIDHTTGDFRAEFKQRANDFTAALEQSKVITSVEVNIAALQSMTADSAVVLVAATSRVTNSDGAQKEPRVWRLRVTVASDAGQLKMSKVEFVL
ncbi:hypothetical protein [Mycobacterium terramassiliense]|nr:hypothetical protein [Mycobacterium terramassiliense]